MRTSHSSSLTCGPKQPGLESSRLHCLGCPSADGLSTSTIHYNQPAEAGNDNRTTLPVTVFTQKKLCSSLSSREVHFLAKKGHFAFLSPPLERGVRATYDVHLMLIGKRAVDLSPRHRAYTSRHCRPVTMTGRHFGNRQVVRQCWHP